MIVVHAHSYYLAHVLLQALVHIILNDLIQQIYIEGFVQQTHISISKDDKQQVQTKA